MKRIEFNPFPNMKEKLVRRAALACLATAAVVLLQPLAQEALHKPTAQEAEIAANLKDAFGQPRIVRCLSAEELASRSNPFYRNSHKPRAGTARPYLPFIWLEQVVCDKLTRFAADPPQTQQELIEHGASALQLLAHEYQHTEGVIDEGDAECGAIQNIGKLGESFGMPSSLTGDLVYYATTSVLDQQAGYERLGQGNLIAPYDISDCELPDFGPTEPAFVIHD